MAAAFKFLEICIGNLNKLFSDGSYIAEPARCQSRERQFRTAFLRSQSLVQEIFVMVFDRVVRGQRYGALELRRL